MNKKRKTSFLSYVCFRVVIFFVKLFYPTPTVEGTSNLPDEATIIVGNHTQMNGPICGELYCPVDSTTWCAWQMMHLKEVPDYAYTDFWSQKPKYIRWFFRLLSYIIAPLSVCVFNNAKTIPVYHDTRLLTTFKETVSALKSNKSVIIFPESYTPHNNIVNSFQSKFIDIAKLYFRQTGKSLTFTPLYIAPALCKMVFGKPITFNPESPIEEERQRICAYLMDAITDIAVNLPVHKVVPYANLPKKDYKLNTESEAPV